MTDPEDTIAPAGSIEANRTENIDENKSYTGECSIQSLDLTLAKRVGVGSGHILNDLCASLWFSYLLLYFQNVVGLSSNYAAYIMLLGQIVDGFSTPLIAYEVDHTSHHVFFCRKYGRCKTWHLFGVILVSLAFPFVFSPCFGCDGAEDWAKLVYYAPIIVVSQIGWASSQISHLALIPKMNPDEHVRTELLAIRYGFTVASNITIFVLAWQIFGFKEGALIDNSDESNFRNVAFIAIGIGLISSIFFHISVHEHSDSYVKKCVASLRAKRRSIAEFEFSGSGNSSSSSSSSSANSNAAQQNVPSIGRRKNDSESSRTKSNTQRNRTESESLAIAGTPSRPRKYSFSTNRLTISLGLELMTVQDWLRLPQFYIVALIYTMTRLSVNVTQVYVPLYLQKSLRLGAGTIATIPLTMYVFGFIVAIFMKTINRLLGRQLSYVLGALLAVSGSVCILVLELKGEDTIVEKYGIYGVGALLGSSASVLLVTSLSIIADLIGNNVESGAFIYGAISFIDKLSCGLAVMLINSMVPCQKDDSLDCDDDAKAAMTSFYRYVLAYASGGCALVGVLGIILVTFIIFLRQRSQRKSHRHRLISN